MSRHPGQKCIRELWDSFDIRGMYGSHSCLVLPPMDMSLAAMITANPVPFPVHLLKIVLRRLLLALDFLHTKAGVVHCGNFTQSSQIQTNDSRPESGKHHAPCGI